MTISTRKRVLGGLVAASMFVALAGCASAPEDTAPTEGTDPGTAVEGFKPCMVSDAGGFDDKSFNQLGYEGLMRASDALGVEPITVQSDSESDFAPNIQSLVDQNCTLIVTVGFALAAAAGEAATANPDIDFVSIDDMVDNDFDGETDAPNIKPIVFDTAQAAFLAGYAAASFSEAKKVGTWGGMAFPTVTIFMDGFAQGVEHWNAEKGDSVEVVGWDRTNPDAGKFTGGFAPDQAATDAAVAIIETGVDVVLPVGGPIYQNAAAVIRDSGRDIALIGVDADLFETDPSVGDLLLTSIRKLMDVGVEDAVLAAGEGEFDPTPFIGTLDNGGVGLAPFHDFTDRVAPELQGELDAIAAGIIDGSIPVESYLAG